MLLLFFVVLGFELKALHMVGKHRPTEQYLQPKRGLQSHVHQFTSLGSCSLAVVTMSNLAKLISQGWEKEMEESFGQRKMT